MKLPTSSAAALRLMAETVFKPFDDEDYNSFQGVDGDAWIGDHADLLLILNGSTLTVYRTDEDGMEFVTFELVGVD